MDAARLLLGHHPVEQVRDAALVLVLGACARGLVAEDDPQRAVEVRLDVERLADEGGVEGDALEDLGVGRERDRRARAADVISQFLEFRDGYAARVVLLVENAAALDLRDERLGERVDDGRADAVQPAARDIVRAVELAARVQRRQDDLEGGLFLGRVEVDGDAAAVVGHADGFPVAVQRDLDKRRVAVRGLVHGVVDDLPHEMVQAALARPADVHAGPLADGVEALEDLDVGSGVAGDLGHRARRVGGRAKLRGGR